MNKNRRRSFGFVVVAGSAVAAACSVDTSGITFVEDDRYNSITAGKGDVGSGDTGAGGEPDSGGEPTTAGVTSTGGAQNNGGKPGKGGSGTGGSSNGGSTTTAGRAGSSSGGAGTGGSGAAGMGGTISAGGTGGAASCPAPYTGTLAKDSNIFTDGYGKASRGAWSGYGFTYTYGTATITPGMGAGCFAAAKLCANGRVPADDRSGAALAWNVAQAMSSTTAAKVAIVAPVKLTFAGVRADMRAQLTASSTLSYCYVLTAAQAAAGTATIPLASFNTECWDLLGTAYDGVTPIESIQIVVPGSAAGAVQAFDLCLIDVEPG